MKYKKIIGFLLAISVMLTVLPTPVHAALNMEASDSLIAYIKRHEGFSATAYWDYQHYSIGYGSTCLPGEYPNGITEEEADALLRMEVQKSVDDVNSFADRYNMTPTQSQFDCMIDLTYALGISWMNSGYTLPKLITKENVGELELMNCMGDWISVGGKPSEGTMLRRMSETYMYFHGEYIRFVDYPSQCPYACLMLDLDGGSADELRVYTFINQPYGLGESIPVPTKDGYYFVGWYDDDGNLVNNKTVAASIVKYVHAKWSETDPGPIDLEPVDPNHPIEPVEPQPKPVGGFTDVFENDWFADEVCAATEEGLFTGYSDGTFRPANKMTRAMFATVLYRIAGEPPCTEELPFTDVASTGWYTEAVRWAYTKGVVNGVSATSFAPNKDITREQMATMLFKYAQAFGATDSFLYSPLDDFTDSGDVSNYAIEPMQWAVGTGLINGVGGNRLSPKSVATRAQAAAILVRLNDILQQGVA